jgi:hypothetical protein
MSMVDRMQRPDQSVLSDEALVPAESLVLPPPTHFTHELTKEQSFRYIGAEKTSAPDGRLLPGTKVVLVHEAGDSCDVIDERGLHVTTTSAGLRRLR